MANIQRIGVLGAGTMGHGIAQVCLTAGFDVALTDPSAEVLAKAKDRICDGMEKLVAKGELDGEALHAAVNRLTLVPTLAEAATNADLIIEAAPEEIDIKTNLFAEMDAAAPAHAILATNTSSLKVGAMAAATNRPGQVIGTHFFNPVPVMALLEIVRAESTSDATVDAVVAFGKKIGKEPIVVKDVPGFASSRLGVILGAEAIRMLETGVASATDIDKAMELGYRHPMGPLKLTDLVGLDVRLSILEYLEREVGPQFKPPALLRKLVSEGKLGRKSGEGFHKYPAKK